MIENMIVAIISGIIGIAVGWPFMGWPAIFIGPFVGSSAVLLFRLWLHGVKP